MYLRRYHISNMCPENVFVLLYCCSIRSLCDGIIERTHVMSDAIDLFFSQLIELRKNFDRFIAMSFDLLLAIPSIRFRDIIEKIFLRVDFVKSGCALNTESLEQITGVLAQKEQKDQTRKAELQKRKASLIKKYGHTNGTLISEGKVRIGMTKEMCRESWGEPEDINKTTSSYGTHEQWVYGYGSYLYFENGKLTTIQN